MFRQLNATRALLVSLFTVTLLCGIVQAAQTAKPPAAEQTAKPEWKGDPYLLPTDAVTGEALGPIEKQVVLQHEGREFRFAKKENADAFKTSPQKYIAAVDEKMVRQQLSFYPLDTCIVSGDKLGADAVNVVFKNRLVRFAKKEHEQTFLKDPGAYIAKLDQAVIAKQAPTYVPKTCPVSGDKLGGDMGKPIDVVIGNRLVRLCCNDCKKDIAKDPLKYLSATSGDSKAAPEHRDGHGKDHPH